MNTTICIQGLRITFLIFFIINFSGKTVSQCPGALSCVNSEVFCSISDLNGFTCTTTSLPNNKFPFPTLCFGVGVPHNLVWWAFIGCGGPLTLTFEFDITNCETGQGIQAGVFTAACDGSEIWDCNPSCQSSPFYLAGNTEAAQTYYLWIDGCNGDVCPFSITTQGADCSPTLPSFDSLTLTTNDSVNICNEFEVCSPDFDSINPTLVWKINGLEISREKCVTVTAPDSANVGDTIQICMIATIGIPDNPDGFCAQDSVCSDFVIRPVRKDTGYCLLYCFEEQPIFWHGLKITSSCISPPCSVRVETYNGPCVDSFKSFILLPQSAIGVKDTFICNVGIPYVAENGRVYFNEVCDELIIFKRAVAHSSCRPRNLKCDTSYYLTISRFKYKLDWEMDCGACSGKVTLCPNVEYNSKCPNLSGQVSIMLDWYDEVTGDRIGITTGDSCINVNHPGRICFNVEGRYKNIVCPDFIPRCIDIPNDWFFNLEFTSGDSIICKDSLGIYEITKPIKSCEYKWSISGPGTIVSPNPSDSSKIKIKWNSLDPDTAQVCVQVITDCSDKEVCMDVFICPKPSSTSNNTDDFTFFYSIQSQSIYWSDLKDFNNIKLTIFNLYGRPVLSAKIRDSEGRIDISKLHSGMYLAILSDSEHHATYVLKCIL